MSQNISSVKVAWFLVIAGAVLFAFWFAYRANTERVPQEITQKEIQEIQRTQYNDLDERQKAWCEQNPTKCKG